MNVLIIGVGNPVPPFIYRRLFALASAGIKLVVVVEHDQTLNLPGARFIHIGGRDSLLQQFKRALTALIFPLVLFKMLSARPELEFRRRLRWAIKYLPLARISTAEIVHFQWLSSVTEFEWLRKFARCRFIASARGSQVTVYPVTRPGYREVVRRSFEVVDMIHCVSKDIAAACELLGANRSKLFVNYNGINLQRFCPLTLDKRDMSRFTMISVGGLMWRKGYIYQLLLLKRLKELGRDVELILIGDGTDREGLIYTSQVMSVEPSIQFVGRVIASDLPKWLRRADLYVSTSVAEGLSNSVVEACACGLPILTFACEGMEEIVNPGLNGFILRFGDIEGMVEKVSYLMDSPQERQRLGMASRERAVSNFDEALWVDRMVELYKSVGSNE